MRRMFRERNDWSYGETNSMLSSVPDAFWSYFFYFSYVTAARQGELFKLKAKHIYPQNNGLVVKLQTEKMREQKFNVREIPIIPWKNETEEKYYWILKEYWERFDPEEYLFLNPRWSFNTNLRYCRLFANKFLNINHHLLRHFRLTHFVTEFKVSAFILQKLAGWSDIDQSKHYVRLDFSDVKKNMGLI